MLRIAHIVISIVAVVSSLTVASKILGNAAFSILGSNISSTDLAAYLAALSTSVLASFSIGEKANNARAAYRILEIALMRIDNNPEDAEVTKLIDAYEEADKLASIVNVSIGKQ